MAHFKQEVNSTENCDKPSISYLINDAENILREFDKNKYAKFIEYLKKDERKEDSNHVEALSLLLKILYLNKRLKSLIFLIKIHHINLESFESDSNIFQKSGPNLACVLHDISRDICDENNGIDLNLIKHMFDLEMILKAIGVGLVLIGGIALLSNVLMVANLLVAYMTFIAGLLLFSGGACYLGKLMNEWYEGTEQIKKLVDEIQAQADIQPSRTISL